MRSFSKITKLNDKKLLEFIVEKCNNDNTFYMTLLEELTDDCPFRESCGEEYMEDYGGNYDDGRYDAYD